jgi:hypothetical protein
VVSLERFGGVSGILGIAAIAAQFALVGTTAPDAQALLTDRMRWEWATLLRAVGGVGIMWFTAALAARLQRLGSDSAGPAAIVLGSGALWGFVWLLSALFNSVALFVAGSVPDAPQVRFLTVLSLESVRVLTPTLTIAFVFATGVAVLASPTFPRRFGHAALAAAAFRVVLALIDWYGSADLATRILDVSLLWVVVTSIHLLGATRPVAQVAP